MAGDVQWVREVRSGGSFLSQNDLRPHFGLGEAQRIDMVEVRWPSGRVSTVCDVPANRELLLREPAATDSGSDDPK